MGTELKKEADLLGELLKLPSHLRHTLGDMALIAHDDNCKCKSNCTPRLYGQSRENLARKQGKTKRALGKAIKELKELEILTHLKRGRIGITAEYKLNTIEQVAIHNNKEQELQDLLYESVGTKETKSRNYKVEVQELQDSPNTFNTSNTKNYYGSFKDVKVPTHPPLKEVLQDEPNPAPPEAIQKILNETKASMRRT